MFNLWACMFFRNLFVPNFCTISATWCLLVLIFFWHGGTVFAWSGHWRTQFCIAFVSFCMVLLLLWNCKPGFHTEFCMQLATCWVYRGGLPGILTCGVGWGGVGWGGVGWGVSTLVFMCTHGTLLVCSCVHMVRSWCVMCKRITQSQCHVRLSTDPQHDARSQTPPNSIHGKSCQMETL